MANVPIRRHLARTMLLAPATPRRLGRIVFTSWFLALAGIWAAQQVHADLHEHVDLPPLLHLLRDGSLAVPLAAVAIALGGLVTVQVADLSGIALASTRAAVVFAVLAAAIFAALSLPGNELHALLFGADEEEIDWLVDQLTDGAIVLSAALAVLLPLALLGASPWPPALPDVAGAVSDEPVLATGKRSPTT
jgi:hypothetical protein